MKPDGFFRVRNRQRVLVQGFADRLQIPEHVQRHVGLHPRADHVVAVAQAVVMIEAPRDRHVGVLCMSEVPFSDHHGPVPVFLQRFSDQRFLERQPVSRIRPEIMREVADRVAAREQAAPGRRADRRGHIEGGQADSFVGHAVELRRADGRIPVTAQVSVSQVVGEQHDDVRGRIRRLSEGVRMRKQRRQA